MPNQQLTTYLPKDLAERVDKAKADGFDPKEIVKSALERALVLRESGLSDTGEDDAHELAVYGSTEQLDRLAGYLNILPTTPAAVVDVAIATITDLRSGVESVASGSTESDPTAYELVWANTSVEFQARLDAVTTAGGYPISIAADSKDRIGLLVAWPQRDEQPQDSSL